MDTHYDLKDANPALLFCLVWMDDDKM